jgi:glucan biosynthesis protein C
MWYFVGLRPTYRYGEAVAPTSSSSVAATDKAEKPTVLRTPRKYYLDNIKTLCTGLIIAHHTSLAYGGFGGWYFQDSRFPQGSSLPLLLFDGFNQSWFMGAFFLISGYFAGESAERKGLRYVKGGDEQKRKDKLWASLKQKWWRLGVPMIFQTFVIHPIARAIAAGRTTDPSFYIDFLHQFRDAPGIRGIAWYLSVNLIFDSSYTTWLYARIPAIPVERFTPPILLGIDMLSSFIVRRWWPVGRRFIPLSLLFSYFPQYILAYTAGIFIQSNPTVMYRRNPVRSALISVGAFVTATVIYASIWPNDISVKMAGGWNVPAALYAVWNEIGFCVFTHAAWELFRKYGDKEFKPSRWAYAANMIHPIVATSMELAFDGWLEIPILKTVVVGAGSIIGSFLAGWAVLKVPGMDGIL